MVYIGGSQAHGAKVGATDDTDWYGLYIPPAKDVSLAAKERSPLWDAIDREAISKLLAEVHLRFWEVRPA